MDLKEEIKVVLSYENEKKNWRNNHNSKEWRLANKVSSRIMKEPLNRKPNCGCLEDLFIMLKSLTNDRINQKQIVMDSKFKLPKGKMVMVHGFPILTSDNLTDENAIELLKHNSKCISMFSSYPDNWKEMVSGKVIPPTNDNTDTSGNEDSNSDDTDSPNEREALLLSMEKSELKVLADNLAEDNDIDKAHHLCGVEGLTKYIIENE